MSNRLLSAISAAVIGFTLAGCSSRDETTQSMRSLDPFAGTGSPYYKGRGKVPLGGGRYHVGKPYQVAGRWFHPKEQPGYDKTGMASWYGEAFHRRMTSNGEWFDMDELTAAHPTLPLPSYAKVTNLANGNSVIVRINDRGPFVGTRVIDLSKRTASVLDFQRKGKAQVRVQWIGLAPLDDKGAHLAAMNRELERGTPLKRMIAAAGDGGTVYAAAVVEPAAKPKSRKAAAPETVIAETPAPREEDRYFVQVASFTDPLNAARAREDLASVGPVEIVPLRSSNGTVYRVRLGPMLQQNEAENALAAAVLQGHVDARVVVASTEI